MGLFDRGKRNGNGTQALAKQAPSSFALPAGAQILNIPQVMPTGGSHVITDVVAGYWFSALQPIKPMAPAGQRVRQYEIQPGANIVWTPKSEIEGQGPGFLLLREFSVAWDMLRIVIETVKDRLCEADWEIRLVRKKGEDQKGYKSRSGSDPRLQKLTQFFKYPDGMTPWKTWVRPFLEDMLVIDAASIYLERDVKRRIANLRVIDGGTIGRMLTDQGFTPPFPQVAYQQVLYGMPAFDLTVNDLLYAMRNPRTNRRYGLSPVEQIMVTIAIGLNRQKFQLDYYTSGNMPEALVFMPQDLPLQRVKETQEWFDSILAGDLAKRRRLTFLPGYGTNKEGARPNIVFPKEVLLKDAMDEWLFQAVAYALGTTPQAMLRMMNRATAQQSAESSEEEGLLPKLGWIQDQMNLVIQRHMQFADIEFAWAQQTEVDIDKQATVDKTYVSIGVKTINEIRERLGDDPFPYPEAQEPGVMTQNGFVPLTGGMVTQEAGALGSGQGPAAKEMHANIEQHQAETDAKQQAQSEQNHQRQVELAEKKPPALLPAAPGAPAAAGPATPPGKPAKKPAAKKVLTEQPHHCGDHAEYIDGCFRCALLELHRVEAEYAEELVET